MPARDSIPKELLNTDVVLDTTGQYVYIGRLVQVDDMFFVLEEVDVHDRRESSTPKEIYIMDARKYGIKKNRKKAYVLARQVASLSALADVMEY